MSPAEDIVRVDLGERSYDIVVGAGLLAPGGSGAARIGEAVGSGPAWIVTDATVADLYLRPVLSALAAAGVDATPVILPAGEASKTLASVERVVADVLDGAPERSSSIIALGGGVVGDIAGFAASMILRGIRFIQVPSTLLAQIDSSVGGKTGINTVHGKNLVGAFYQPRLVVADTGLLDSLPRREVLAGYAEVVKYALLGDRGFFDWLEDNAAGVVSGDADARREAVRICCAAKAAIVGRDERESGARALLNLGHTFGHALEAETGYGPELLHGEAVAIGIVMAFELSAALGLCPAGDVERVRRHFARVGLPVGLPSASGRVWDPDALLEHMRHDKKVRDGRMVFILVRAIGEAFVTADVDPADVRRLLAGAVAA